MMRALSNVELRLTEDVLQELQDEAEEFNFDLNEYMSLVLIAVTHGKVGKGMMGSLFERIDWNWMREQKICE